MRKSQRNLRVYATVNRKPAYKKKKMHKFKANRQAETNSTPIRLYQAYMPPDPTQKLERKSNSNTSNAKKITPKGQLLGTPQQSRQFCYGEKFLWLGVPQQTPLTPKINLSQYAIERKCLTLKDQTSYLIPDG